MLVPKKLQRMQTYAGEQLVLVGGGVIPNRGMHGYDWHVGAMLRSQHLQMARQRHFCGRPSHHCPGIMQV
jgi:hypothetical protein